MLDETTPAYWFELWREAGRWHRALDRALAPLGLTHTQYLVLDAAERLETVLDDAFKQRLLVDATGLEESTISAVMRGLHERGLVDRGLDGLDARMWRVIVCRKGRRLLSLARPLVEGLAQEFARAFRPMRPLDFAVSVLNVGLNELVSPEVSERVAERECEESEGGDSWY